MKELLIKSMDDVAFIRGNLLEALPRATSVESIVIMGLLKKTAELKHDLDALLNAHMSDQNS